MSNENKINLDESLNEINLKMSEITSRLDTILNEINLLKKQNQFQTTRPIAPHYKEYIPYNIVKK